MNGFRVTFASNVICRLQQGTSKLDDWVILVSIEGTVRNGVGDSIKMELLSILGEYYDPHVIFGHYRLDDVSGRGSNMGKGPATLEEDCILRYHRGRGESRKCAIRTE